MTKYPGYLNALDAIDQEGITHGDVLSVEWLHEKFGVPMPTDFMTHKEGKNLQLKFVAQLKKFADRLLVDKQMMIDATYKKSYKILEPYDQVEISYKKGNRDIRKTLKRMAMQITNVDVSQLTDEQKNRRTELQLRTGTRSLLMREKSVKQYINSGNKKLK